jgi:lipoprotein LprG
MKRLVVAIVTALALTACGSGGGSASPQQAMQDAKSALDGTAGVHVTISSKDVPSGQDGLTAADVVLTRTPAAFKGTASGSFGGFSTSVDAIGAGGKIYFKLPMVGWQSLSATDIGFPDPALLLDPNTGLSSLLLKTKNLSSGAQARTGANNDVIVTTYTGTLASADVSSVLPVQSGDFQVTYQVGQDKKLAGAIISGPFYKGATSTYTLTLDQYGTAPTITAP